MLHNVGNNRDCDVDVDHRNNTNDITRSIKRDLSTLAFMNDPTWIQFVYVYV